jgi:hypothetical protein
MLATYLNDTAKGRRMLSDGTYTPRKPAGGKRPVNSQESWIPKRRSTEGQESAEKLALKHRPDD